MATKSEILTYLSATLYNPPFNKLSETIKRIYDEHKLLTEDSLGGFWFKGEKYGASKFGYVSCKQLHPTLHADMQAYVTLVNEYECEQAYVKSYITAALNLCKLDQIHHLIPASLHEVLKNRGVGFSETPPEDTDDLFKYNQKGYDLLLQRILRNTVGF